MNRLPEMLTLLGRWSGIFGLICAVIGIVLGVGILAEENPILALVISLSVIGLVVAVLNLVAKKGRQPMNKIVLEIDLSGITLHDLDLACDGITSALALLEAQGYTDDGGEINAGLSLAKGLVRKIREASSQKLAEQGWK